ncbi:hypothetical protein FRC01_007166 [Tulasnella sp. 417]|nr:hypothetical protein FRC01_007166 [Tulasnella sp. 417]
MNQLEVLANIASVVASSSPSGLENTLPSTQQTSAPTRALSDEGWTNKESPRSTYDSSSETSLYDERSAAVVVSKAIDMEVGVLNTILPNASPPASLACETSGIGISILSPVFDAQQEPHTPEVVVRKELGILQNFVPSSDFSIVTEASLEVSVTSMGEIVPVVLEDSSSGTVQQALPPATAALPSGLPVTPLEEEAVPTKTADATTSSVPSPHVENPPWSALQTAERASTRLACKAASQSPTTLDLPQTPCTTADVEMHTPTTPQKAADVASNNSRPADHSLDEPSKSTGANSKVWLHLRSAPATPERLQKPLSLASPKGAKFYVEIPKVNLTAPTPAKRDHILPTPGASTSSGSSTNIDPARPEDANTGDVVMRDPETSGRSSRKRTQNILLRDFVHIPSESESRSPSPRPPASKKKRKESNEPGSTHLDSSALPPKKRAKRLATAAAAPAPSIHAQGSSMDGEVGPTVPVSQASLTSTRRPTPKSSSTASSGPFIQKDRCIKFNNSVPRCHACISKKTGELCRYIDLRQFPGGTPQQPVGQPTWIDDPREPQEILYPSSWNVAPTPEQTKRVLKVAADALLPYLARELSHTRIPGIIRRNRELECRASCEVKERMRARNERNPKREDNRLMYCQGGKVEHYGPDLRPITRFRKDELEITISDMGTILIESKMDLSSSAEPETGSSSQPTPIVRHDPSDPVDPSGVGTLPFHVFTAGALTEEIFAPLWAKGQTVVVTGLLDVFKFKWTPEEFIRRYGSQTCHVVDCYDNSQSPIAMNVESFFSQFGQYEGRTTCWKLKDWPPASLFSTEFPELFKDFAEAVPVPNYTRRDGVLNLAAHYPTNPEAIHYYLDSDLRKELFEREGVKSWRIYQKPGEAVFIPAGCAHQVCNLADCIKVAVDFVSPENIGRCELLTAEFRQQNLASVWKDDVLQLRHTLLYAWNSMKRKHPSLSQSDLLAGASTTPPTAAAN